MTMHVVPGPSPQVAEARKSTLVDDEELKDFSALLKRLLGMTPEGRKRALVYINSRFPPEANP